MSGRNVVTCSYNYLFQSHTLTYCKQQSVIFCHCRNCVVTHVANAVEVQFFNNKTNAYLTCIL